MSKDFANKKIKSSHELGKVIRMFRKKESLTLEQVSGLVNVSMKFLSEVERGKETAQIGKILMVLNKLGLDVIIQPRYYDH